MITWLLFLAWLTVSIMSNLPRSVSAEDLEDAGPIALPNGARAYAYDTEVSVGFPVSFLHVTKKKTEYKFVAHAASIGIAGVNLLSLVYCAQSFFGQFSLRTIIAFVTLTAILIAIGQAVFAIERGDGEFMFIATIFFSPLAGVVPAFVWNSYRSK